MACGTSNTCMLQIVKIGFSITDGEMAACQAQTALACKSTLWYTVNTSCLPSTPEVFAPLQTSGVIFLPFHTNSSESAQEKNNAW